MPPMENSCHVFLQKHSVPKDLDNNYAVTKKKKRLKQVRYSIKFHDVFFEALDYLLSLTQLIYFCFFPYFVD